MKKIMLDGYDDFLSCTDFTIELKALFDSDFFLHPSYLAEISLTEFRQLKVRQWKLTVVKTICVYKKT